MHVYEFGRCVCSGSSRMFYINLFWSGCDGDTDFTLVCAGWDGCPYCLFDSFPQFLYSVYEEPTKFGVFQGRLLVVLLVLKLPAFSVVLITCCRLNG